MSDLLVFVQNYYKNLEKTTWDVA